MTTATFKNRLSKLEKTKLTNQFISNYLDFEEELTEESTTINFLLKEGYALKKISLKKKLTIVFTKKIDSNFKDEIRLTAFLNKKNEYKFI